MKKKAKTKTKATDTTSKLLELFKSFDPDKPYIVAYDTVEGTRVHMGGPSGTLAGMAFMVHHSVDKRVAERCEDGQVS